jgi:hypothetical protein
MSPSSRRRGGSDSHHICLTACIVTVELLERMLVLSQSEEQFDRRNRLAVGRPASRLPRSEATADIPSVFGSPLKFANDNANKRWIKPLEMAFLGNAAQI